MNESKDNKFIPMTSVSSGSGKEVSEDLYYYTNQIVNVAMIGKPGEDWVLVDAGMPKSGPEIEAVASKRFGENKKPQCILLTHGHFDHIGGLIYLLEKWDVPVYAHMNEFPFLNGSMSYPEPDPSVEGGLLAKIASIYPHEPINIVPYLLPLPIDKSVPNLPGWQWLPTPGHSPGQVAFFRQWDRTLISGDAFITVKQDSLYKVLLQVDEVNGPPSYFTTDWRAAWDSVKTLAALQPEVVIPGHGQVMRGIALRDGLDKLAIEFDHMAIPAYGKYV